MSKMSLEEATLKTLYNELEDDITDVDGIIDDVVVVTDPEITEEEYDELIERAQEIVEDTEEGSIPLDEEYLGQYLLTCPICGVTFIHDEILEPGAACPNCTKVPEAFVVKGRLESDSQVAEEQGLEQEETTEEDTQEPVANVNTEENEEDEEKVQASEQIQSSENKLQESETKEPVKKESKEIKTEVEKKIDTRVLKLDDGVEVEIEVDVTPGFEKEIKKIWYTDYDGTSGFGYDIKTDSFVGFDNPNGSFLTPIEDEQIKDEIHKILNEKKEESEERQIKEIEQEIEDGEKNGSLKGDEKVDLYNDIKAIKNKASSQGRPLNECGSFTSEEEIIKESLEQNEEDGWGEDINEILAMPFEDLEKLMYEVRNCRRGSYAHFGDTVQDLATYLREEAKELEATADQLDDMKEQLQESKEVKTETTNKSKLQKLLLQAEKAAKDCNDLEAWDVYKIARDAFDEKEYEECEQAINEVIDLIGGQEVFEKFNESKKIKTEEITINEITQLHQQIESAEDMDEVQQIIYTISDGVLENEVQLAFDQCERDGDDLDITKDFVISTLEDNAEYNEE